MRTTLAIAIIALLFTSEVPAQTSSASIRLANQATQKWQIGVKIKANGTITGIEASLPVPMNWPEQRVKVVGQDLSRNVRPIKYRTLNGGAKQMIVVIPRLRAGESAHALVTFEVTKSHIKGPLETDDLQIPKSVSSRLRQYLLPSPSIESNNSKIKSLAQQIVTGKDGGWQKTEAIFDWVRENVEYKFDPTLRGALVALDKRVGDCEEMTSLFVAFCRVNKIPARSVWIPGHCYPEFYLVDASGRGQWYPCQAAGTRAFGSMPESRPVLQKGDSFRVPRKRRPVRYVSESLQARDAAAAPSVEWVRKAMPK